METVENSSQSGAGDPSQVALMLLVSEVKRLRADLAELKEGIESGGPNGPRDAGQLYDTPGLAARWLCSARHIENLCASGALTPTYIGSARRFTPASVNAFERSQSGLRMSRAARRRKALKRSPLGHGLASDRPALKGANSSRSKQ